MHREFQLSEMQTNMRSSASLLVMSTVLVLVSGQNPTVRVNEGLLVGKTVQFRENKFINITRDVDLFLGVPFADPPERFEPPEPKTPWDGEWNATEFSPVCQQAPSFYFPNMSEDCLYLNVYAPNDRTSNMPVMVWIHGGAFSSGSAMTYDYYGVPLAAVGDVIVVSLNYRLAIFAQFSTEDNESPGNYGMLDQVAALKWIYENIEAFGGDKDRITIFGESAGSASVSFHLLSKLSQGYFQQALLQSGTVFSGWSFRDNAEQEQGNARKMGDAFGCDVSTSASLVSCLKAVDANELNTKADEVYEAFYPVTLDGSFLEDTPDNLYKRGDFIDVPMLIGFNKDEGTLNVLYFVPGAFDSPTAPMINRTLYDSLVNGQMMFYGYDDDILHDAALQEYTDWTIADDPDADFFQSFVDFAGDMDFSCPSDRVARAHVDAGGEVFKYFMTHAPSESVFKYGDIVPNKPWLGAGHAEELLFVFGMPFIEQLRDVKGHNLTDEEKALSVKIMTFWTNFAKTGDPSKTSMGGERGTGQDSWPRFTIPELEYKELSLELGEGRAVRARQCHLWNEYIQTLRSFTNTVDEDEKEWKESYGDWKNEMDEWRQIFEEYQQYPTCN